MAVSITLTLLLILGLLLLPLSFLVSQSRSRRARLYHPAQYIHRPYPFAKALLIGLTLATLCFGVIRISAHRSAQRTIAPFQSTTQPIVLSSTFFEDSFSPAPEISEFEAGTSDPIFMRRVIAFSVLSKTGTVTRFLFFAGIPLLTLSYAGYHLFIFSLRPVLAPKGFAVETSTPSQPPASPP